MTITSEAHASRCAYSQGFPSIWFYRNLPRDNIPQFFFLPAFPSHSVYSKLICALSPLFYRLSPGILQFVFRALGPALYTFPTKSSRVRLSKISARRVIPSCGIVEPRSKSFSCSNFFLFFLGFYLFFTPPFLSHMVAFLTSRKSPDRCSKSSGIPQPLHFVLLFPPGQSQRDIPYTSEKRFRCFSIPFIAAPGPRFPEIFSSLRWSGLSRSSD